METGDLRKERNLIKVIQMLIAVLLVLVFGIVMVLLVSLFQPDISLWFKGTAAPPAREIEKTLSLQKLELENKMFREEATFWHPADFEEILSDSNLKKQIAYGRELIIHTAKYLGPKGSVLQISNGMNCQNCHLEAGTKIWGNNYGAVFSTYPKYRARSGREEDIYKRINDCIERSLNGSPLSKESTEMQALKSYIEFVGQNVKKGEKPKGTGIYDLPFPDRAADPVRGKELFIAKCQSCHQSNGEGLLAADGIEYTYPPLWGRNSYNMGAGLLRLSRFAGFIKYNMPQGATFQSPQLTDEESWDIAAYVNSQVRPSKDLSKDWPNINEKPVDHPFGIFADKFSEKQHKYGPFKPIANEKKKQMELQGKTKT